MRIKKIEWKNFSSYGNRKQTVELPDDPGLFQIFGENGAGKTTILQVISFCLYGKVEGKKLGSIPNRINGNTWTRVEFIGIGNRNVIVERGLEPSFFNLTVDQIPYDQSGKINAQEYLTEDLIGIPYYVFNNTLSLSINDFKSFIKMKPDDKRAIVDKIFGFHVLNQMREALKSQSKKVKEELDGLNGSLRATEKSLEQSNLEMESLLLQIEENSKDQIVSLNESLEKFKDLQIIHSKKIQEFKEIESSMIQLISNSNSEFIYAKSEIENLEKRLKLYSYDKCPTCESRLDTESHSLIKNSLNEERTKAYLKMDGCKKNLDEAKIKEKEILSKRSDLQDKGNKIQIKINEIIREIEKISSKDSDSQVSSLRRILEKLENDKSNLSADVFKTGEKSLWIKRMDDILGEKGVKQMAIKTILPSLNSEILDLIREMCIEHQVVFDEEFKATLYHMGAEIPSETLSTGEMKKMDFIVLIAIMKLMKMKFSTINVVFLDELLSSVDPEGISSILKILRRSSSEMGLNIFIMNHAPMPHEFFDWKLEVSKSNKFSSVSIERF